MSSFLVTIWDDLYAKSYQAETVSVEELGDIIGDKKAAAKEQLPLITCGRFGTARTKPGGALRSEENMQASTAANGDHDAGAMPFQEMVARLNARGIAFVAYTTGRNAPGAPRWRVHCPYSRELPLSDHARMTDRLNGLLAGELAPESWTAPQGWFIGAVDGVPFEFAIGEGEECIDECEELDAIRRGKPGNKPGAGGKGGKPNLKNLSEDELEEEIKRKDGSRFHASGRLLWLWALQEIPKPDAQANLEGIFDSIPQADRGPKWPAQRRAIPQWTDRMYARAAKHLGTFLARLVSFFTEDPRFRDAIRLNEFTQTIEVPQPFPPKPGQAFVYRALREVDTLEALLVVQADGFAKATISDVWRAIILTAEHQGYHSVREYLNSLKWDEIPRIHRLFFDYFPGKLPDKDQPQSWWDKWAAYYEATGLCFMISCVARIFEPGCKVDNMVIFESAQGYFKALALQALVGNPAWFTDDVPVDVVDKDAKDALVGKWIAELSETPHLRRDVDRFKAFVSRMTDRFRRAYERLTQDWPRQTILVGTRNELVYLDVTGNRRFWGIPLAAPVNVDLIKQDRDRLWAEAVHLYKNKTPWWLSEELEKIAAEIQGGYVEEDVLEQPIEDWLEKRRDKKTGTVTPFEMTALLGGLAIQLGLGSALGLHPGAIPAVASKPDQMRVANCLKRLGFRREVRRNGGGKPRRVWVEQKTA